MELARKHSKRGLLGCAHLFTLTHTNTHTTLLAFTNTHLNVLMENQNVTFEVKYRKNYDIFISKNIFKNPKIPLTHTQAKKTPKRSKSVCVSAIHHTETNKYD